MIQHAPATANNVPVYLPQLSAARPRGGMRNLGELVDCLIRTYEAQARVLESFSTKAPESGSSAPANHIDRRADQRADNRADHRESISSAAKRAEQQATFDWYQNRRSGRSG